MKDRLHFTNLAKEKYPDWNSSSASIRAMYAYRDKIMNEYLSSIEGKEAERQRTRENHLKIVAVLNQPKKPRRSFTIIINLF